jgi:hypothetical protein
VSERPVIAGENAPSRISVYPRGVPAGIVVATVMNSVHVIA